MKIDSIYNQIFFYSLSKNTIQKSVENNNIKSQDVISKEEKMFFANMFPDKSSEVMNYNFYNRNGKINNIQLGSLLDRRF